MGRLRGLEHRVGDQCKAVCDKRFLEKADGDDREADRDVLERILRLAAEPNRGIISR